MDITEQEPTRGKPKPIFNHLMFSAERRGYITEIHTGTRIQIRKRHAHDEAKYFYKLGAIHLVPKIAGPTFPERIIDGNLENAADRLLTKLQAMPT